jgi:hypothetical protein
METPAQSRVPFGDQPATLMQARPWLPGAIKNRLDRRELLVVYDKRVDLIPQLYRQPVPQRILHDHIQARKPVGYRLRLLDDGAVISREHAIRLVEELLRAEEREFAKRGKPITLAITRVTEHRLGWIIGSQSEAYLRSGNTRDMLRRRRPLSGRPTRRQHPPHTSPRLPHQGLGGLRATHQTHPFC